MTSECILEAPSIAEITRLQMDRPAWARGEPLAVGARLFEAASKELEGVMAERGWCVAADEALTRRGVRNFLLWGHPVVIAA